MQITQTGGYGSRPAHSASGARPGYGPTPRSRRNYSGHRDGAVMRALRATAYVLTSLASALFIALVVYGAVQVAQMRGTLFAPAALPAPSVAESDDYAALRESVAANDGLPTTPDEERYLADCAAGTLPGDVCP